MMVSSNLRERQLDGAIVRPEGLSRSASRSACPGAPFDGLAATIIEMDEKDWLIVPMHLLKRPIKVKTESRNVAVL